jgi:polysaccharide export outer membrane protein
MKTTVKMIPGVAHKHVRDYVKSSMTTAPRRLVFLALSFVVLGCGARHGDANALYADAARNDPRTHPYQIGVSDVVRVTVWKDPNLSTDAAVRPDGNITLPLVGEVLAAGRTVADLQGDIGEHLSAFAKDAVVTVAVVEVNSYRLTVAGNVERPGMFTSRYYVTVSEAIALAGGPNRYASTGKVVVVRGTKRIPIDYDAILSGKSPEQDIVVLAGDAVRVP